MNIGYAIYSDSLCQAIREDNPGLHGLVLAGTRPHTVILFTDSADVWREAWGLVNEDNGAVVKAWAPK